MRIDSHQHYWKFDPVRDAWIDEKMRVIQRDFFPADLEPLLRQNKMDGSVAVQADQSETETRFLLDLAKRNPFIKGVVGWIDLSAVDIESKLNAYAGEKLLKGFRHIVQGEQDPDFMNRHEFLRGINALKAFNYTYDILIYERQLPMAIRFVQHNPDQKFVLDHIAKPLIKKGALDPWQAGMKELALHDNVCCKLSGMVTEADWGHWKKDDFRKYLDVAVESFGPKRLMFGSDWPVCLVAASYEQQLNIVEDYLQQFSAEDRNLVMGQNAVKFYNL